MLNRRQVDVQYQNLATMCRMTVKALIDYACVNTHVDEDCEEFVNFCAVFEQMVAHRIRPYQKKVWHRGQGLPRHFWEVMLENHRHGPLFRSCIPNIEAIESIKSPKAKLRAFVRVALMEKRLSDYLQWLQNNRSLMEDCYLDGALFISEEGLELCGDIIGLSAIDFNFCLRGNENELLGPLEINYVPFLNYTQSPASRLIDEEEMLQLSGKTSEEDRNIPQSFDDDRIKLQNLERDFRGVKEQKDYLEELVRLRERQMGEATRRVEAMRATMQAKEKELEGERKMLNTCVIELQEEMSNLRHQNSLLKAQVADLQMFKSRLEFRDVQMVDLAGVPVASPTGDQAESEERENEEQADERSQAMPSVKGKNSSSAKQMSSDQRSILSGVSDQIRLKEDTQSLVPLTGSLADVNIAMIRDNQQQNEEAPSGDWKRAETDNTCSQDGSKDKDGFVNVELTLFESDDQRNTADATVAPDATEISEKASHLSASSSSSSSKSEISTTVSATVSHAPPEQSSSSPSLPLISSQASNLCSENMAEGSNTLQKEKEFEEQEQDTNNSGSAITQALEDLGKAFDNEVEVEQSENQDVQPEDSHSSCSGESNGSHGNNSREDVNTSSTSDPEIIDKVNTSSEGSDAAWELLSDPDENDK